MDWNCGRSRIHATMRTRVKKDEDLVHRKRRNLDCSSDGCRQGLMTRQWRGVEGLESLCEDHCAGGSASHGGPDHQSEEAAKSGAHTPLLARSAGLSAD